jgi:hypothetical protein
MVISQKKFLPCPEGIITAKCVEIKDLGVVNSTNYGPQEKIKITWETTSEKTPDGKPYRVQRTYGKSLNRKSQLYADLKSWLGAEFPVHAEAFDTDRLIDRPCSLRISHNAKGEQVYANVDAVFPAMPAPVITSPAAQEVSHE